MVALIIPQAFIFIYKAEFAICLLCFVETVFLAVFLLSCFNRNSVFYFLDH